MCICSPCVFLPHLHQRLYVHKGSDRPKLGWLIQRPFHESSPQLHQQKCCWKLRQRGCQYFCTSSHFLALHQSSQHRILYCFLNIIKGSLFYSGLAALSFFYMVASWGGYAFIINIIPIFNVYLFLADRMTTRAYVAYSTFYIMGTILAC